MVEQWTSRSHRNAVLVVVIVSSVLGFVAFPKRSEPSLRVGRGTPVNPNAERTGPAMSVPARVGRFDKRLPRIETSLPMGMQRPPTAAAAVPPSIPPSPRRDQPLRVVFDHNGRGERQRPGIKRPPKMVHFDSMVCLLFGVLFGLVFRSLDGPKMDPKSAQKRFQIESKKAMAGLSAGAAPELRGITNKRILDLLREGNREGANGFTRLTSLGQAKGSVDFPFSYAWSDTNL